ncbi:MAG TPA: VWA domain-containing protein [Thermoanaerobaculia bacterium]|nr:VWA domain-containing protein [Thermoanaerobaculia bacterium]
MNKPLLLSAVLLLPLPLSAAAPAPPSFGETVEVNVINVDVYVTDRSGHRVTGLKKGDFEVLEDGKAVAVSNFEEITPAGRPAAREASPAAPSAPGAPAAAAPAEAPDPQRQLSLVVFVDNLHIRPQNRARAVEQIRKFLARSVQPGDRVMLATYDNNLRVRLPFTGDRQAVDAALREIERLPAYGQQEDSGRREAYRTMLELHSIHKCGAEIIKPVEGYAEQTRADALRTVGALTVTINSLSGVPGHKALLFVSDGISITPGEELFEAAGDLCGGAPAEGISTKDDSLEGPHADAIQDAQGAKYSPEQAALDAQRYSVAKRFEDLAAHASANRVTFYTLQASGLQTTASVEGGVDERLLQSGTVQQIQTTNLKGSLTALAVDTGGRAMLDANDFLPELARMQEDFESYYSLGYTPAHNGDGRDHKIEVKLKRPGLQVRYRQTYRDKPMLEKMADRTLAALFHGFEENPLEVQIEIGDLSPAGDGQYSVPVRLRIPLFKLAILNQDEIYRGKLRLLVATRDENGGASPVRQVEVPLNIPRKEVLSALGQYYLYTLTLKMKPGAQHVAVAVRDEIAATTSYLSRPVQVGAATATSR